MRRLLFGLIAALIVGGLPGVAMAKKKSRYKKRTVIDLSAAVIEGELTRPEGSYIVNRKLSKFSGLIQDRSDFVPELLSSPNDL